MQPVAVGDDTAGSGAERHGGEPDDAVAAGHPTQESCRHDRLTVGDRDHVPRRVRGADDGHGGHGHGDPGAQAGGQQRAGLAESSRDDDCLQSDLPADPRRHECPEDRAEGQGDQQRGVSVVGQAEDLAREEHQNRLAGREGAVDHHEQQAGRAQERLAPEPAQALGDVASQVHGADVGGRCEVAGQRPDQSRCDGEGDGVHREWHVVAESVERGSQRSTDQGGVDRQDRLEPGVRALQLGRRHDHRHDRGGGVVEAGLDDAQQEGDAGQCGDLPTLRQHEQREAGNENRPQEVAPPHQRAAVRPIDHRPAEEAEEWPRQVAGEEDEGHGPGVGGQAGGEERKGDVAKAVAECGDRGGRPQGPERRRQSPPGVHQPSALARSRQGRCSSRPSRVRISSSVADSALPRPPTPA